MDMDMGMGMGAVVATDTAMGPMVGAAGALVDTRLDAVPSWRYRISGRARRHRRPASYRGGVFLE